MRMNEQKRNWLLIGTFIAGILMGFIFLILIASHPAETHDLKISYFEDREGQMDLTSIKNGSMGPYFKDSEKNTLVIGQSRSIWWIKIENYQKNMDSAPMYLSVNNPSVRRLVLYSRNKDSKSDFYTEQKAGWYFKGEGNSEAFVWPVFQISPDKLDGSPIYLKLDSPYSQNYSVQLLTKTEFELLRLRGITAFTVFIGFLIAMGVVNLIHFVSLRNVVYLRYVLYVLMMIIYHGALLGLYHVWLPNRTADLLISQIITIGVLMLMASLYFFKGFLNVKEKFPLENRLVNMLMLSCVFLLGLMLLDQKYYASILSTSLGCIVGVTILWIAVKSVRKGIREARYFLIGWLFMISGIGVFALRVYGFLPNNLLTLNAIAFCSSVEALFLSAALDDHIRILKRESSDFELAFLQAQINPHFLFNALNVIATLCLLNVDKARQMILDLSEYLHYSYSVNGTNHLVPIEEELRFVKAYVRIEQERFPGRISVTYDLKNTEALMVPKLLLQPLVENAIKHGILKGKKAGTVHLSIRKEGDGYLVEVQDDGMGMSKETLKEHQIRGKDEMVSIEGRGVGLENVQKRLRKIYGSDISIESQEAEGTIVKFRLPEKRRIHEGYFSR